MKNVLIVGCGDIGHRVALHEQSEGRKVFGLARYDHSAQRLGEAGIEPVRGDLDRSETLHNIPAKDTLLYYFAPPPPRGERDTRMENFVSALLPDNVPDCIVLISTTGIYGDCRGDWVTEERTPNPQTDRARRRFSAETILLNWGREHKVPITILRVPGIYGPGRLPEKRLRSGEPVLREEESPFSNRIHADDLARVCVAAARRGRPGRIYNVSDGHPTTMTHYFYLIADLLGVPRPPAITMAEAQKRLSEGMISYLSESRRIDNRRMIKELGITPMYPDLKTGLLSCIVHDAKHWVREGDHG
jgi:nucleoside-diphosphate-sugar epimerase